MVKFKNILKDFLINDWSQLRVNFSSYLATLMYIYKCNVFEYHTYRPTSCAGKLWKYIDTHISKFKMSRFCFLKEKRIVKIRD